MTWSIILTLLKKVPVKYWIAGGLMIAIAIGFGVEEYRIHSLNKDLTAITTKLEKTQSKLDVMTANRNELKAQVDTQNIAIDDIKKQHDQASASADLAAVGVLRGSEKSQAADDADKTSGSARMNSFIEKEFSHE